MEFLEAHARALYRLLNHGDELSDCRALFAGGPLWDEVVSKFTEANGRPPNAEEEKKLRVKDRTLVRGESEFIAWCRTFNGTANCYVGRNPRNPNGTVSRITTYSLDVDPEHPPRTSVDSTLLEKAIMAGRDILQTWPGGYMAESGNGVLVIYRLANPVVGELDVFKRWLAIWQDTVRQHVADRSKGEVRCDPIHDNERIIKIPGTLSVKGASEHWRNARWSSLPTFPLRSVPWNPTPTEAPTESSDSGRLLKRGSAPLTIERLDLKIKLATESLARLKVDRCEQYDSWIKVGLSLSELGPVGLQLWDTWSKKSPKYQEGACAAKWGTFTKDPLITVGSLVYWADQDSPGRHPGGAAVATDTEKTESIDEFLADAKPIDWICQGLLARGQIGFIAGLPETMKTWLAIDLALEATRPGGGKWLGLFPVKESRVLYIDQERPRGETQRRFKGVMAAKGLTNDLIRDRFSMRIATTTRLDFHPSFEAFKRTLREKQPDIVLIDSFATFHNSDENSLPQMQRVMEAIKTLRNEFNCAIWFIDHENKGTFQAQREDEDPSAFRIKGSIAKTAAIELALTVRRYDAFSSTVYNTKNTMAARTVGSFTVRVQDLPDGGGIDVRGHQ